MKTILNELVLELADGSKKMCTVVAEDMSIYFQLHDENGNVEMTALVFIDITTGLDVKTITAL